MTNEHINPVHWQQSLGLARQSCARIFRDGGKPEDALTAFGIASDAGRTVDWFKAVEIVAEVISSTPTKRAA